MTHSYSIVGLGKLGASMAAAIASRGFDVIGVDISRRVVELMNDGHAPTLETDLEKTISDNKQRIRATLNHKEAILGSDVTFVIVPTPSDERGAFSLQYAAWAFGEIGRALAEKDGYQLIVMTSTVLPGATRYGLLPILERVSGKVAGSDFGLCYSPEFIALGSVIHDFLNPDFTLVGEIDKRAGDLLEACYSDIMLNSPPCKRMSLENAELTKIALNTYITTKITYANMLADLCERIPGGNVDVVTDALGSDQRVGSKYLQGAIGYGGPCFPRDNIALSFIANAIGSKADLAETTDQVNRNLPKRMAERISEILKPGTTVAVLGLAYKPYSHVIEESQGIYLAKALSQAGARVVAFDPLANEMARAELRDHAVILSSVKDCLAQAEIVVITTPDPAFQELTAADFGQKEFTVTVVDFWRILKNELDGKSGIKYIPIGYSTDDPANEARLAELWSETIPGVEQEAG